MSVLLTLRQTREGGRAWPPLGAIFLSPRPVLSIASEVGWTEKAQGHKTLAGKQLVSPMPGKMVLAGESGDGLLSTHNL